MNNDVTLRSAASNLAGLYRLSKRDQWLKGLAWDPVPIDTLQSDEDAYIGLSADCPRFTKLYKEVNNLSFFTQLAADNAEFYKLLSEKTGWNVNDLEYIRRLEGVFAIYYEVNKTYIPSWAKELDETRILRLAGYSLARRTWTPELARLLMGPFLDNFIQHHDAIINQKTEPKFIMISGGSILLASIQNTMGIFNLLPPEFESTLIWELYKTTYGKYYVKIYRSRNQFRLEKLKLKHCDGNCEYDKFKQLLSNYTVDIDQWTKECNQLN